MKTVIIGGGIAGMAAGSFLDRNGMEVVICERQAGKCQGGHAFLMHSEALSILNELNAGRESLLPGKMIHRFILRRPEGHEVRNEVLDSWRCIKRTGLVEFLDGLLPEGKIKYDREFSHFLWDGKKVAAAVFTNGEVEYGDIFIGADGGYSKVREDIFGKVRMTKVVVKEIVGIFHNRELGKINTDTFFKYQDSERGLAFGVIPTGEDEFVWFMQYDPRIADLSSDGSEEIRKFCYRMLKHFPTMVRDVLHASDFTRAYRWNTRDFNLLPAFHRENVVLLGDAAHLTLPFTSAGTTNAIIGAKTLAECLNQLPEPISAFTAYYRRRATTIEGHVALGRRLSKKFLHPLQNVDNHPLPFLSTATNHLSSTPVRPTRLQVLYFTDPICSTCWIFQPLLKKMNLEYGHCLDLQYYMGGLLPSWQECKGKIKCPSDAAQHWKEVGELHEMPIVGDVWIEDPLSSSFPPSIAFKAAQLQDPEKAISFLRRIREMVFVEKKNIMKWEYIVQAALEADLDPVRLLKDFNTDAQLAFEKDLALARKLNVASFPTLILSDGAGRSVTLKGDQQYTHIENAILKLLPTAKKKEFDRGPESLFSNFPTMMDTEFALLSDLQRNDAVKVLQQLNSTGYIERLDSPNGTLWRKRVS